MLSACDRIVVMSDGRVTVDINRADLDDAEVAADDPAYVSRPPSRSCRSQSRRL